MSTCTVGRRADEKGKVTDPGCGCVWNGLAPCPRCKHEHGELCTPQEDSALRFVYAVGLHYPRYSFPPDKAMAMLEHSLRDIPIEDVVAMLRAYSGQRPDEAKPPWEEIISRLQARGYGRRAESKIAGIRAADARHRQSLASVVADLAAKIPQDRWPDVYAEASGIAVSMTGQPKPVPEGWEANSFWVNCVRQAWERLSGAQPETEDRGRLF